MNEKNITLFLSITGSYRRLKFTITPKTTTRALRGQLAEILETGHILNLRISTKKGESPVPQGQDLFPLVDDGGRLYAVHVGSLRASRLDLEELKRSFVGVATDSATDVAEKHDLYLAGLLR